MRNSRFFQVASPHGIAVLGILLGLSTSAFARPTFVKEANIQGRPKRVYCTTCHIPNESKLRLNYFGALFEYAAANKPKLSLKSTKSANENALRLYREKLEAYSKSLRGKHGPMGNFAAKRGAIKGSDVPGYLDDIKGFDVDGDGISSEEEIAVGSNPGDRDSKARDAINGQYINIHPQNRTKVDGRVVTKDAK